MPNNKHGVPDRWLKYKAYGTVIPGTNILPFKTPLKESVCARLPPNERFTTATILQAFPNLKCVINLTNCDLYYEPTDFTDVNVRYKSIKIIGHQLPSMSMIENFYETLDDFRSSCGEDGIVGVHCTHGINRTGYLICRYLVERLGWKLEDSLQAFSDGRHYFIERQSYLDKLHSMY